MKLVTINGHRRLVDDNYVVPEPEKAVEKVEEPVKAKESETKAQPKPVDKAKKAPANKSRKAGSDK